MLDAGQLVDGRETINDKRENLTFIISLPANKINYVDTL